jgi:glutamate--cysteine ligase
LYLLLYGSSPLANNSFAKDRDHDLEELNSDDIYKPYATSLRMGDLGYISEAQDSLNISYNSIEDYCADLKNALETSYPLYKKIGEFNGDERIQLNDSIIQIENEYYSTIRPKRVCPTGERPLNVLSQEGIDYLELRCIDLNPDSIIGISEEQIYFLDLLILYCFLQDSPSIDNDESNEIFKNHKIVVNAGRSIDQTITSKSSEVLIKDEALRILNDMDEIAKFMDEVIVSENENIWLNTLKNQKKTLNNLDSSLSGSLLKNIIDHGMSFQEYGMHVSNLHQNEIKNISPKHTESLIEASKKSLQDARDIESSQQEDFEDYLKEFLNKIS